MAFTIESTQDELLFRAYTQARDEIRAVMGHGVYPNLAKAIQVYDAFDAALAGELADADLLAYHGALMAPISQYIAALRAAAAQIVATMAAIELAQPGTFGITVATPEPDQPAPEE